MLRDSLSVPDWHTDAACIGKWEMFDEPTGDRQIEACRTICFTQCPVRSQCLHDALKTEDPYFLRHTFRGGYMPTERSKLMGTINRRDWTWEDSRQF